MTPYSPPSATLDDLATALRLACMRISRRARFEGSDMLAPHQFSVLVHIEKGATTPGDLAELEKVSAPSMTRTISALEGRGYVVRSADENDRRCVNVTITPAGLEILRRVRDSRDEWMATRVGELTAYEQGVLREASGILRRLADS